MNIHVYINRVFKIKDGYKLELKMLETMKLFGAAKKINRQNKKLRKVTRSWSSWSSFIPV